MLAEVRERTATPITQAAESRAKFPLLRLKVSSPKPRSVESTAPWGGANPTPCHELPSPPRQVDYTGFTTCNPQRFGQRFVDKVERGSATPSTPSPPAAYMPRGAGLHAGVPARVLSVCRWPTPASCFCSSGRQRKRTRPTERRRARGMPTPNEIRTRIPPCKFRHIYI